MDLRLYIQPGWKCWLLNTLHLLQLLPFMEIGNSVFSVHVSFLWQNKIILILLCFHRMLPPDWAVKINYPSKVCIWNNSVWTLIHIKLKRWAKIPSYTFFFNRNLAAMKKLDITLLFVGTEFEYKDKRVWVHQYEHCQQSSK